MDLLTGEVPSGATVVIRRASDMKGLYQNRVALEGLIKAKDPVVYQVYNVAVPERNGELQHCVSIIYPGKVGDEYFMTKGHFHARRDTAEVYLGLRGKGKLLLQTEKGEIEVLDMFPGSILYIPPYWGHRTVNVGDEPLIFFAIYPGDAGHDYQTIEAHGFRKVIVERDGKPVLVDNPNYRPST